MFFDFLSSYRFHRNVSVGLHCHCKIATWMFLDLVATSSSLIFASCFYTSFRTTWISSTSIKMTIPFCPWVFINKLNKVATFSSQKGRTAYDCHLLECMADNYLHLTSQITIRPIDKFKHWSKTSSVDDVSVKTYKTRSLFTCPI